MTEHKLSDQDAKALEPAGSGDGAIRSDDGPVVTDAMVEAGFEVLQASGIADDLLTADKCTVAEVFRAMFAKHPHRGAASR
ncbi:MAG: hypothetical protein WD767_10340 [Alphaproteobacteria bacterium]